MLYLNQRNFYDVPYNHDVDFGGAPEERRNVGTSGCGICCMSMVVNHLTGKDFPVKDCVRLELTPMKSRKHLQNPPRGKRKPTTVK